MRAIEIISENIYLFSAMEFFKIYFVCLFIEFSWIRYYSHSICDLFVDIAITLNSTIYEINT